MGYLLCVDLHICTRACWITLSEILSWGRLLSLWFTAYFNGRIMPWGFIFTSCVFRHLQCLLSIASRPCLLCAAWGPGRNFSAHSILVTLSLSSLTPYFISVFLGYWFYYPSGVTLWPSNSPLTSEEVIAALSLWCTCTRCPRCFLDYQLPAFLYFVVVTSLLVLHYNLP